MDFSGRVLSTDAGVRQTRLHNTDEGFCVTFNGRHTVKRLRTRSNTVYISPYPLLRREKFIYFEPDKRWLNMTATELKFAKTTKIESSRVSMILRKLIRSYAR